MSRDSSALQLRARLRHAAANPAALARTLAGERAAAKGRAALVELADAVRDVLLDGTPPQPGQVRLTSSAIELLTSGNTAQLAAIEHALTGLQRSDPQAALVARLRFWANLELDDVATLLDLPLSTVRRAFNVARGVLRG